MQEARIPSELCRFACLSAVFEAHHLDTLHCNNTMLTSAHYFGLLICIAVFGIVAFCGGLLAFSHLGRHDQALEHQINLLVDQRQMELSHPAVRPEAQPDSAVQLLQEQIKSLTAEVYSISGKVAPAAGEFNSTHLAFVEVGTSDFQNLAMQSNMPGLSVDAVPVYIDRLPARPGLIKQAAAISDQEGNVTVYAPNWRAIESTENAADCDKQFIKQHSLTQCVGAVRLGLRIEKP